MVSVNQKVKTAPLPLLKNKNKEKKEGTCLAVTMLNGQNKKSIGIKAGRGSNSKSTRPAHGVPTASEVASSADAWAPSMPRAKDEEVEELIDAPPLYDDPQIELQ